MNWRIFSKQFQPILRLPAFLPVIAILFSGCGIYSFSGASIHPDVKTVSVAMFPNRAPIVAPELSQIMTEKLKTKFLTETQLRLIPSGGDFAFSGAIINYAVSPVQVQGNTNTILNRLNITMNVKFENSREPALGFEQNFNAFKDFEASKNFAAIESQLISDISELIIQEIFNKAVINW